MVRQRRTNQRTVYKEKIEIHQKEKRRSPFLRESDTPVVREEQLPWAPSLAPRKTPGNPLLVGEPFAPPPANHQGHSSSPRQIKNQGQRMEVPEVISGLGGF